MSKVANMLNMLKILEDRKKHSIKELADKLEISPRMVRGYKQELEQAGIYIFGKQGVNGGYILEHMKNSIDIGLTEEEIYYLQNIIKDSVALEIIDKISNAYRKNEYNKNESKISKLLPEFSKIYQDIRIAINNKNKVFIKYNSINSGDTERIIHPAELFAYLNDWYVAAFCELRNEIRLFKLKDISSYDILEEEYDEQFKINK